MKASSPEMNAAAARPSWRFMLRHPAHAIALGLGAGLAPRAPGTAGTLAAWLAFAVLDRWFDDRAWAIVIGAGFVVGCWACTVTARALRTADPGAVVWDEVLAFWIVLWWVSPAGLGVQLVAFALFRLFDAVKRGPVGWVDRLFEPRAGEPIGWRQGFGIMADDLVAAWMTVLVLAAGGAVGARLWN